MKGPDEPDGPNHEWFRRAKVDPRKFDLYLLNPDHPANHGKAKGRRETFGVGSGDGPLLERLIREQLDKAEIKETESRISSGEASGQRRVTRKWELPIPKFEVPGRRSALVATAWARDPGEQYPHMVTAVARP